MVNVSDDLYSGRASWWRSRRLWKATTLGLALAGGAAWIAFTVLPRSGPVESVTAPKEPKVELADAAEQQADPTGDLPPVITPAVSDRVEGTVEPASLPSTSVVPETFPDRLEAAFGRMATVPFLASYIEERFSSADLPLLYDALRDDAWAPLWIHIVFAVCVLDEDAAAVKEVERLITTPWDWRQSKHHESEHSTIARNIILSVTYLGAVAPETAGPLLRRAFSDGESVLAAWNTVDLPGTLTVNGVLLQDLIYGAASGMLHSRSPELFSEVERRYAQLAAVPRASLSDFDGSVLTNLQLILAQRDFYNEMGWDEGIAHLYGKSFESRMGIILKYLRNYPNTPSAE